MSSNVHDVQAAPAGKRLALVIGVNKASSAFESPLHHAISDAEAMAEVLQQHCSFELVVPPLLEEQATSEAIRKAVRQLARDRTNDDFLLLYFAGHGLPMTVEAGRYAVYLGSSDLDKRDIEEEEAAHISLKWLRERLYEGTQAGHVLLILDCCFSGDMSRTAPDRYLEELKQRIRYYSQELGENSQSKSGGLRFALTATGHNAPAAEGKEHGLMTGMLLSALRGEVDAVLDIEHQGEVSLPRLYDYLKHAMPAEQPPSLAGDSAGRSCILASYPERVAQLRSQHQQVREFERPHTYVPFPRNPLFQPRPDEFNQLEALLCSVNTGQPVHIGLVGVTGMGGIGKTQLAVELAYRLQEQHRFAGGIFWTPATGTDVFAWQRHMAALAFNADYLPADDDPSSSENEARRARYFCRYLANHPDTLLILDNVENPDLVASALPVLAGSLACSILYTSRITQTPPGIITHSVKYLSENAALHLLLETTRPVLLSEALSGTHSPEANAARSVCSMVGYVPLALVHLRSFLTQDRQVSLCRLVEVLNNRGISGVAATVIETFRLSWEKVRTEEARRMFLLASYFPEAAPPDGLDALLPLRTAKLNRTYDEFWEAQSQLVA